MMAPSHAATAVPRAELRRLLALATPAPWFVSRQKTRAAVVRANGEALLHMVRWVPSEDAADAAFIAAARAALPALLDALDLAEHELASVAEDGCGADDMQEGARGALVKIREVAP